MNTVLRIEELTKRYSTGVLANDRVTFNVQAGEVVGLLGHNGAGKTTLVRAIGAQIRPSSGSIRVAGKDIVAAPADARRLCSVQPQSQVSINGLTPRNAINLVARLRGAPRRAADERTKVLADRLEIGEWLDQRSGTGTQTLTGGVLRLIAFCMTVVSPGRLIVLDEPTNDVDPVRRRYLWAEIRRLANQGHAILVVTHNVVEAERWLDRVLLLHHGRLIVNDSPESLLATVDGELRVDVRWEPGVLPEVPDYLVERVLHGRELTATVGRDRLTDLMAWGELLRRSRVVEHFSIGTATLDDVYIRAIDHADRSESGNVGNARELVGLPTEGDHS